MHKLCPKFCADASADRKHLTGETSRNVMMGGEMDAFTVLSDADVAQKQMQAARKGVHMTGESEGGKGERLVHVMGTRVTQGGGGSS